MSVLSLCPVQANDVMLYGPAGALVLGSVTVFLCFLVVFLVFWLVVVGIQWFLMLGSGGSGTPQEKFPYESTQLVTL